MRACLVEHKTICAQGIKENELRLDQRQVLLSKNAKKQLNAFFFRFRLLF